MVDSLFRLGIDIDGTITYAAPFFALLTNALKDKAEIHIITARCGPNDPEVERKRILDASNVELKEYGIYYDFLVAPANKGKYIKKHDIKVMFEDTDEEIIKIPASCLVFKIREEMNFCWDTNRWLHSDKTSRHIHDL